jgi:hypothetical protein
MGWNQIQVELASNRGVDQLTQQVEMMRVLMRKCLTARDRAGELEGVNVVQKFEELRPIHLSFLLEFRDQTARDRGIIDTLVCWAGEH